MTPPVFFVVGLLACTDSSTSSEDSAVAEPGSWHALLTADGLLSQEHPPLLELDSGLARVWEGSFDGLEGRGAQGIDRDPAGRTVYTRVTGSTLGGWVDVLGPDGELSWTWDGAGVGGLSFPHGVAWTPWGDLVIADTSAARLISVDLDGQLLWEEPLPTTAPNGLALWTDDSGVAHMLVTGRHALTVGGADDQELINRYRLADRDQAPTLTWSRVLPPDDAGEVESPHGPTLLDDGSALYCARGQHQLVRLDADGEETWRSPLDRTVLDKPQDVAWVDGALLVADSSAGQLLRFDDPFDAFDNTANAALDGIFGVQVIGCGPADSLPCYGPSR